MIRIVIKKEIQLRIQISLYSNEKYYTTKKERKGYTRLYNQRTYGYGWNSGCNNIKAAEKIFLHVDMQSASTCIFP
jgi:hypothetical protein